MTGEGGDEVMTEGEGRGMGGSTSSCTLRSAEGGSAAKWEACAAALMGRVNAGADPYADRHSAVVWVVDVGCLVQEPAGCLPESG